MLDKEKFTVDAYTPYYVGNDNYVRIIEDRGGQVYSSNVPFNPGGLRLNIISPLSRHLKKHQYDVIHIHSGSISVLSFAAFIAKINGVGNVIVHSHATGFKRNIKYWITKWFLWPLITIGANHYCACSTEAGEWKFTRSVVKNNLNVINNGINLMKYAFSSTVRETVRTELGYSAEDIVIGQVGRFSPEKNHMFTLEIFARLLSDNRKYRLLLVGEGDTQGDVREQAERLNLSDRITYTGSVPNVNDYMQAMDIMLFPSLFEGLGIVAIEAQASGLQVIASTNVPEKINATGNVVFLDLDNKDAWIEQIIEASKKKRYSEMEVLQESGYSIEKTVGEVVSLYYNSGK